jgi:hypothetical protein
VTDSGTGGELIERVLECIENAKSGVDAVLGDERTDLVNVSLSFGRQVIIRLTRVSSLEPSNAP